MHVSVMGRIGYDLFAEDHGVPLKEVKRFSRHLGGSSANLAVGLARLGLDTGIIGCLGDDPLGEFLVEYLQEEGIDTSLVQFKQGFQSSLCLCEVSPPDHFPQVFYRARAADTQLEVDEKELQTIVGSGLFVTNGTSLSESPSRESTLLALETAKSSGVTVAFDVDFRRMSWESEEEAGLYSRLALPLVDILLANQEELAIVGGSSHRRRSIDRILDRGVSILVAKLGSDGTIVATPDESLFLPAFPVPVLSAIGAGDGFASGFLYAYAKGIPLPESLRYGNAAAAIVVSRLMCAQAMPRLDELKGLLELHPQVQAQPLGAFDSKKAVVERWPKQWSRKS